MNRGITEKINLIEGSAKRSDLPTFDVGDVVKMKIKVKEADKVRLHQFEGTVIKKTGKGLKGSFTVRKISFGEGVERIFPTYSPVIDSMHIVSKGVIKRAKLYYLRGRLGKKSRVQTDQFESQASAVAPVAEVQSPTTA